MALFPVGNVVIVCIFLLSSLPLSLQACPPGGIYPPSVEEGEGSLGHVLEVYGNDTVTNLTLTDTAEGYLAINVSSQGGYPVFTLYVAKTIDLEELKHEELRGKVVCADQNNRAGYNPSGVLVTIRKVNDFPPQFNTSSFTVHLREDSKVGSTVFDLAGRAEDKDFPKANQILYRLLNRSSPFSMNNGHLLVLDQDLDYERGPTAYILNISAEEQERSPPPLTSYATLTIYVTDVDDLGPQFNHSATYTLALPEGDYNGSIFTPDPVIFARDSDSLNDTVLLKLDPTSQALADRFTILPNGSVRVSGTFEPGHITLNVRAYQKNRPSDRFVIASVIVTVYDVNNHSPVMSSTGYSGTVMEGAGSGTVVLTVSASDGDKGINSSFQFHLNDSSNVPFSISTHHTLGIVTVSGSLDRERQQFYLLHVYAQEDQSVEKRSSNMSEVNITVLDANDNIPEFHGQPYRFYLNETDLNGTFVGQVNATDADSDSNGQVVFSITAMHKSNILSNSIANDVFAVDSSTGVITLIRNLTQQDVGVVFLDVRADDSAPEQSRRSQSIRVTVTIAAVNQYPPEFASASYNFTVAETAKTGDLLGTITATDKDQDTLTYWLVSSQTGEPVDFKLEGNPPSLQVNGSLDLDTDDARAQRTLTVVASDGTYSSTASVTVSVTAVNEYTPIPGLSEYSVSVKENDTVGDTVLTINATDGDSGPDGELHFAITSPPESQRGPFGINATSGVISLLHCTRTCLDYNSKQQYALVIRITDGGSPVRSTYCTVVVNVEDVNNQAPFFSPDTILGSVSEDAQSGTTVLQLRATDEDTPDPQLTYSLNGVDPAGWLKLTGRNVVTNGSLDAETAQHITATVTVFDGVQTGIGLLNVTVLDVNDNYPQITLPSNSIDILENATVGTSILNVTAHDRDVTQGGSFLFYLARSPSGKFAIDSATGEMTVAAKFDRRLQKEYDVTITVSDNSAPPKTNSTTLHVVITDSNSAPQFVNAANSSVVVYSFNVSEEEQVGYVLGLVKALDPDSGTSGQVSYSISSNGNQQDTFRLDADTGQLSLNKRVNYEQKKSYSFTIMATDNSYEPKNDTATVLVYITDIVEAPQWPESLPVVHLMENGECPDGMQVNARPRDILRAAGSHPSDVVYALLNHTDQFHMNNVTGLLSRRGHLQPGTYALGLRACSALNETVCSDALLTVIVSPDDVISFCPPFLTAHVNENETRGHVVVDMNSTSGDVNTTYSLKDSSLLPFAINESTGIITVEGALDREEKPLYTLDVVAHYLYTGATAAAQVTVVLDDVQDSTPAFQFRRYDGQISEAAHMGDPVRTLPSGLPLRVIAEDRDLNSVLTYSILPDEDNSGGAFSVNSSTGEVTLQRTVDRENMTANLHSQYTLTVMVTDGIYNDTATVVITVLNDNDNSPVFVPDILVFNVSEAQDSPFTVAVLSAEDLDEGDKENLRYSLLSSDAESLPFEISSSGVLQLTRKLDREKVSAYNFTVEAVDGGQRNGTAQIHIQVMDANEAPYFEKSTYVFNVTEGPDGLLFEQNLTAVDNDIGSNAVLTFHIVDWTQDTAFNISTVDDTTGALRVVKELDREATSSLTLTVIATDAGHPSLTGTCRVEVNVVDVNDHDPEWTRVKYKAVVSESAPNNTQVTLIPEASVSDADEGVFGVRGVVYSLEPSYPEVPFRVDAGTGRIYVTFYNSSDHLDREVKASYALTLEATDDNGQGRKANSTVVVHLLNVNDHPPAFSHTLYRFNVSEGVRVGWLVGRLQATDPDNDDDNNSGGSNNTSSSSSIADAPGGGVLRFYLHPPGGLGLFYLEPVSGELRVSGPLDRETRDHYVLSLGVYDGLFWGNATAEITVNDVNDNCPDFNTPDPLTLTVTENQDPEVIYVFNVTDSDAGSNADVTLYINDTNAENYLSLSANGTLRTTQRLDREKDDQKSVTFSVWARDGGDPACVTSLHVRLEVEGDNEVAPEVCQITREQKSSCGQDISVQAFDGASQGTFLAALTWRDSDEGEGGQATLSLQDDPEDLLTLNRSSASTSLLTLSRTLDRADLAARGRLGEDNSTYRAVVRAEDGGRRPRNSSVEVVLTVLEVSPTTPVFAQSVYHFEVRENQPATVIGRVEASAQNHQLSMNYALQSAADFSVDAVGNVSTQSELDRERTDQYTFLVLAWESSQRSQTATAAVLVQVLDTNDNAPVFSGGPRYDLTVPENLKNVSLMTFVASDRDAGVNGEVTYSLVNNSSFGGVFVLNETSGQLWLNQSLDRETKSSYILHVQAQDEGTPVKSSQAILEVTVKDINDNHPVFSEPEYVGYVDENAPAATLVKTVTATDADSGLNGQVLYHLVTETTSDTLPAPFFINEFSGAIYTARSLHYQAEQTFNLTVEGRDLGSPAQKRQVPVQVLVNDLSQVLPQVTLVPDTLALVLGTPPGTGLPVNVSGGFGVYNFSFVGGNEESMFAIDRDSGEIRVTREVKDIATYQLTIRVVNLQAPQYHADGKLTVLVTSVRLDQEQYAAVVPENRPPPFLLLDINSNAERAGVPVTYRLRGEGIAGVFSIAADSGQLFCNKTLDREHRAEYIMTVSVQLAHAPSVGRRRRALSREAEIRVIVDDVNDNPPRFDVTSNVFGIPSSAPAYTVVTTLKAKDPDAGTNGEVVYTVTGGDTNVFYVTSGGEVTSLEAMTGRKSGEQFRLLVNATDNGGVCGSAAIPVCQRTRIEIKIVVVPNSDRFGLVANITVSAFVDKQQLYLRNLSDILNMTLQLDKVEPHQGTTVDATKSDIYFYAFDKEGKPIPYTTVNERVKQNADAIHALFKLKSVQLIPVTQRPTQVRVETRSVMGEAEVAVIVVASLILLGSFVAIILTIKAWRKQKEFQRREEAAVRARQKMEQEAKELADKIQETSFVADPEEPLELDMDPEDEGRVFNPRMFLKNMRESEYRPEPVVRPIVTEVQELVMNFDNESTGVDTLVLRRDVLQRTEAVELEAIMKQDGGKPPSTNDKDSGMENHSDSLSSDEGGSGAKLSPTTTQKESNQPSTSQTPTLAADHDTPVYATVDRSAKRSGAAQIIVSPAPSSTLGTPERSPKLDLNKNVMPKPSATLATEKVTKQTSETVSENRTDKPGDGAVPTKSSASSKSPDTEGTQPAGKRENVSAEDSGERPEDPEPDYQKRVSFSNILDSQKDGMTIKDNTSDKTALLQNSGSSSSVLNGGTRVTVKDLLRNEPVTNYRDATSKLLDSLRARKSGRVNPAHQADGKASPRLGMVSPASKADGKVSPGFGVINPVSKADGKVSPGLGVINPIYQADSDVLDGWAEDYDSKASASPHVSTAL